MTIEEIEAHDLRKAAVHECGHAYVTRHYGMGGEPSIWRSPGKNTDFEKVWIGSTRYQGIYRTPLRDRRIALAGIVAEDIDSHDSLDDFSEEGLAEYLELFMGEEYEDSEGWSRTDWEGAQGWTSRDLHAVCVILMRNWTALLEEAEQLISDGIKDGVATSYKARGW